MDARTAIETAALANGWTLAYSGGDSYGAGTDTYTRDGVEVEVRFTIRGTVQAGEVTFPEETIDVTGTGKREQVIRFLETYVSAPETAADESEQDAEGVALDDDTTELSVCTDCAMVLANAECTHEECMFPAEGFDPVTDCPTVKGQAAVWGDDWSGLILSGAGEDESPVFSTMPCEGCGDDTHGDRHPAAHIRSVVVPVIRAVNPSRKTLLVRGPWNRRRRAA